MRAFLAIFATLSLFIAFIGSLADSDTTVLVGILGMLFAGVAGLIYLAHKI